MYECSLEVFLDCVESFVYVWRRSAVFLKKAAKIRAFIAVLPVLRAKRTKRAAFFFVNELVNWGTELA